MDIDEHTSGYEIAIVGMALRVPGANTVEEFWRNVRGGTESVESYSDDDLQNCGVDPALYQNPNYVKAGAPLEKFDHFDPEFFGFSPKEAAILDPQHRHFYECAWEALERSGHPPGKFDDAVGVFAGCGMGSYYMHNIVTNVELMESVGPFLLRHTGNDKDFLTTRVSYAFDLKGPSINVQTACSTSAVATHLACQSLLTDECDMALAGGVTIETPHGLGYLYKEGEILSPDGHCRPFDHRAAGTIFGSGVGVVVLRRLDDAIRDGDHIHAVISGSAINNDGSNKVGYLAPSVDGQSAAIAEALAIAEVSASDIGLVECHGTGTAVGDPIEVAALTQAFKESSSESQYCGIGSVKSNIGHLDTAAGVVGLIKAALAIEHAELPPTINYEKPNASINFGQTPFYVVDSLRPWQDSSSRRAAVNSLGVGGTNAFLVLEQAPPLEAPSAHIPGPHLFAISAKNRKALDEYSNKLADHLEINPNIQLSDVAQSLFYRKETFEHRRVLASNSLEDLVGQLRRKEPNRVFNHFFDGQKPQIAFMFPGGGAQYAGMGRDIYAHYGEFRKHIDRGVEFLAQAAPGVDYREMLLDASSNHSERLQQPSIQLPLIFIVEYALAQQWKSLGLMPDILIGHSMGENMAACFAGVMSFEDALGLILLRGRLMESVESGGMVSVEMPADELDKLIGSQLDLASINAPEMSVASGSITALEVLEQKLSERGISFSRIPIGIAAHSKLLDPVLDEFKAYLESIELRPPTIPIISNSSGEILTDEDAISSRYWVKHLRGTVRFSKGIDEISKDKQTLFLEVGPGNVLSSLARQHSHVNSGLVLSSMRHPAMQVDDLTYFMNACGRLWANGIDCVTKTLWPEQNYRYEVLPTYAFQSKPYWIDASPSEAKRPTSQPIRKLEDHREWMLKPVWIQQGVLASITDEKESWLVFKDNTGFGDRIIEQLRGRGQRVLVVEESDGFHHDSPEHFFLSPEVGQSGYRELAKELDSTGSLPTKILHLWLLTNEETYRPGSTFFHKNLEYGFYSLFYFARALAEQGVGDRNWELFVFANGSQAVNDGELLYPEKATALGPTRVIPREFLNTKCRFIDIDLPNEKTAKQGSQVFRSALERLVPLAVTEIFAEVPSGTYAYRENVRWHQTYTQAPIPLSSSPTTRIRNGGVYLITGGLGGIGMSIAESIVQSYDVHLVLLNRTPLPAKQDWERWLDQHDTNNCISQHIRNVMRLEQAGAFITVESCDVTDAVQMRQIVNAVENEHGPIRGLIHAAGVVNDNLIHLKSRREIEETFAPKIYGTLVLDEIFKQRELDFFVLFSSTSTAIAPIGQADYVAANTFLNAFAQKRHAEQSGQTIALNWGIWNEVGMAVNSLKESDDSSQSTPEILDDLLFEERLQTREGSRQITFLNTNISPASNWILGDHRTKNGEALWPGTGYLTLLGQALSICGYNYPHQVDDMTFVHALYVPDGEVRTLRAKLVKEGGSISFEVQSLIDENQESKRWLTHAHASVSFHTLQVPSQSRLSDDMSSLNANAPVKRAAQSQHLQFGPNWQVLKDFRIGDRVAHAVCMIPEELQVQARQYAFHPGLLDIASGFAMQLIPGYDVENSELWIPISYGGLTCYKPLPTKIFSEVRIRGDVQTDSRFVDFKVDVYEESGELILSLDRLTLERRTDELELLATPTNLDVLETEYLAKSVSLRHASPAELRFRQNLAEGIRPTEGWQMFANALTVPHYPELIVSSLPLGAAIVEAENTAREQQVVESTVKFSRPELDNDYVEPRDDIDKTIIEIWEGLLGVDGVGIQDDFFELGGHSLLAVRLFAKIQQKYHAQYPISVLFEAPTIQACSDLIRASTNAVEPLESENLDDASSQTQFTHIVPMHDAAHGKSTPLFFVAGMFGNVLNLRHLANHMGVERPFYALQARGLYGESPPHSDFVEMARDYIKEIRQVQPTGPYLIGGYSGGGITAYEICRQLLDAGESIMQLVFLDTPLPTPEPLSFIDNLKIHWQRFRCEGPIYPINRIKDRVSWELRKRRGNIYKQANQDEQSGFQSQDIEIAFRKALDSYTIRPLAIKSILFRPRHFVEYNLSDNKVADVGRVILRHDNRWSQFLPEIEVVEIPGNHDSMVLEPNVRVLASHIETALSTN